MDLRPLVFQQEDVSDESASLLERRKANDSDVFPSVNYSLIVDDVVDNFKIGLFHFIVVLAAALCYAGYNLYYHAIGYVIITACELNITQGNKGWLSLCFMIGLTVSSGILGAFGDNVGRRKVLVICMTVYIIATLLSVFAYNYIMLVIMGGILGIANGGIVTTATSYVLEFFPRSSRGKASGVMAASLTFGGIYSSLVALIILPHPFSLPLGQIYFTNWRLYILVNALPVIPGYLLLLYMPESLRFVLVKGKGNQISHVLSRMDTINSCCKRNDYSFKQAVKLQLLSINKDNTDENNDNDVQSEMIAQSNIKLYKKPWIIRLILLGIGWVGYCFCNVGFTVWLPTLVSFYVSGKTCGHYDIVNSSWAIPIHHQAISHICVNQTSLVPTITNILYANVGTLPFSFLCIALINRAGRKWQYCSLAFITSISVLLIWVIDTRLATMILITIFTIVTNIAWIPYTTWTSELFPTEIRSTVTGILNIIGDGSCVLSTVVFTLLFNVNCTATIILYSLVALSGGIASLFLPDTTNIDIK